MNFEMKGYAEVSMYINMFGKGVSIYCVDCFSVSIIEELTEYGDTYESLLVRCSDRKSTSIKIGGIFRPPSNSVPKFVS